MAAIQCVRLYLITAGPWYVVLRSTLKSYFTPKLDYFPETNFYSGQLELDKFVNGLQSLKEMLGECLSCVQVKGDTSWPFFLLSLNIQDKKMPSLSKTIWISSSSVNKKNAHTLWLQTLSSLFLIFHFLIHFTILCAKYNILKPFNQVYS